MSSEGTIGFIQEGKDKVKLRYSIAGNLVERTISSWTSIPIQDVKVTGEPVSVGLNRTFFTHALRFGLNELEIEHELAPVVFSNGGKRLVIMPVNLGGPVSVQPSPQAQPHSEATTPTTQQNRLIREVCTWSGEGIGV